VQFLESALPDLVRDLSIDVSAQTYQRWADWSAVHGRIVAALKTLPEIRGTLQEIAARRQDVMKVMGSRSARPYHGVFHWERAMSELKLLFEDIQAVLDSTDLHFTTRYQEVGRRLQTLRQLAATTQNFLFADYLSPLLDSLQIAVQQYYGTRQERMAATILPKTKDGGVLAKAYALYDIDRDLSVSVPLHNDGPGTALQVEVRITPESDAVVCSDVLSVGDIPPGPFSVSFSVLLEKAEQRIGIQMEIRWRTQASDERQQTTCRFFIESQRSDIQWPALETLEPYSTAVAEGDQFVGRSEKVRAVAGRLMRARMQSTYITGQKRIGKTSLAFAIRDYVRANDAQGRYRFLDLEWGAFARSDPSETVQALGEQIAVFLGAELHETKAIDAGAFRGTLAPLVSLSKKLQQLKPDLRFVVVLDEFDEIHPEMYQFGRLAEAVFSNLRTLSSQKNIAFILVGGEKMPFVMSAQGDQLNQFVREELDYFSRVEEWNDVRTLICSPVEGVLTWRDEAINEVFTQASGHPYYTKLLCAQVFRDAVRLRDADITQDEVRRAVTRLIGALDVNAFAHYWKDGIRANEGHEEAIALSRSRLLACAGRVSRASGRICAETIRQHASVVGLATHEVQPLLNEFCRRAILQEVADEYRGVVPLFEQWLREVGVNRIIVDTIGDEFAAQRLAAEDAAYVHAAEIVEVVGHWPSYRGRQIGTDDVRKWLGQVRSNEEQRYLFKILQNVRYISETQVREKLRLASNLITGRVPEFVRTSRSHRRQDVLVTFVDGVGKSGSYYASKFAEENVLDSKGVVGPDALAQFALRYERDNNKSIDAVIVVDDLVGTGKSLTENLRRFVEVNKVFLRDRSAFLGVVALFATTEGETQVRRLLSGFDGLRCDLRVCEHLTPQYFAFPNGDSELGFWASVDEREKARALCREIGSRTYKRDPLGFGGQGLLLVFPNTVPNNSLPILHSASRGDVPWRPIFERPTN
jgi:hypothetical protein